MYKVKEIGRGLRDRFNIIESDELDVILTVFNYDESFEFTPISLVIGQSYIMKLYLLGRTCTEDEEKGYGYKDLFEIIEKERIGCVDLFRIKMEIGEFYIPINDKTLQIYEKKEKGWYYYTRIDIIQLDDVIRGSYLKEVVK